jgi:hypothetical protein
MMRFHPMSPVAAVLSIKQACRFCRVCRHLLLRPLSVIGASWSPAVTPKHRASSESDEPRKSYAMTSWPPSNFDRPIRRMAAARPTWPACRVHWQCHVQVGLRLPPLRQRRLWNSRPDIQWSLRQRLPLYVSCKTNHGTRRYTIGYLVIHDCANRASRAAIR